MNTEFYQNRRIFLTGHTGFKGAWLAHWLLQLGAEVHGYALPPPSQPAIFDQLDLEHRLHHTLGDVRDLGHLRRCLSECKPEIVFHLAAQPLVRQSYVRPVETFATNTLGTVHLLDALRTLEQPCAVVIVSTDKCYDNREWSYGYREIDRLGGADPYSCSKAMAELAVDSYRRSYFRDGPIRVATARAGNVIGGGDWAVDRIIPDCVRAVADGTEIAIRRPQSRRPWQHVLEPLRGYLHLAAELATRSADDAEVLASAFNFGPPRASTRTVRELVTEYFRTVPGRWRVQVESDSPHEAEMLHLCTDKAKELLNWHSIWDFETSVRHTAEWYQQVAHGQSPLAVTSHQLVSYAEAVASAAIPSNGTTTLR